MAVETFGIVAAMQPEFHLDTGQSSALAMQRLSERQARVGIMANQVDLALPIPAPRDVWTRWPNLQSARRQKQKTAMSFEQRLAQDRVLNGDKLNAYTKEMRGMVQPKKLSHGALSDVTEGALRVGRLGFERPSGVHKRGVYSALRVGVAVLLGIGGIWWFGS
ncbi:hypothetical protein [Roseinatronobacter monicus]|uniref:hypothetical protein n=1 Tax=Roseinatronobacter monicus TaxID=393481 RepID=UPI003F66EEB6